MRERRLGIDFGGVIARSDAPDDGFFGGKPLATPPVPGAFDEIARLVARFDGKVWIVCKASPGTARLVREWLRQRRFHDTTGVPEHHVRFCRHDREKVHVASSLGITHFIDDTPGILRSMRDAVPHRFLLKPPARRRWNLPSALHSPRGRISEPRSRPPSPVRSSSPGT